MIQLNDLLGTIRGEERVKIIGQEMYSGISGKVEELEEALNDSILHNCVESVVCEDAEICIYTKPDNPYSEGNDEDGGANGWCDAEEELPNYNGWYLVLYKKPYVDETIFRYDIAYFDNMSRGWATDNIVQHWHELPKCTPKEEKA